MKRDSSLLLVEVDLVLLGDLILGGRIDVEQALHDLAARDIDVDDLLDVLDLHHTVQSVFRINLDERSLRAETEAADDVDGRLVREAFCREDFVKLFLDLVGVAGEAARAAAEHDVTLAVGACDLLIETFCAGCGLFI